MLDSIGSVPPIHTALYLAAAVCRAAQRGGGTGQARMVGASGAEAVDDGDAGPQARPLVPRLGYACGTDRLHDAETFCVGMYVRMPDNGVEVIQGRDAAATYHQLGNFHLRKRKSVHERPA